jgi:hypothetical protein
MVSTFLSFKGLDVRVSYSEIRQTMFGDVTVSVVGLPLLSRAGVKRPRLVSNLHVVLSSAEDPLDFDTVQPVTRPFVPI